MTIALATHRVFSTCQQAERTNIQIVSKFCITRVLFLTLFLVIFCRAGIPQETDRSGRGGLRVMFYNVENLFDTVDDPLIQDEEFLPQGERYWTPKRYMNKLINLYKVIIAVGEWTPPEIIGLCEVENRKVLEDLIHKTPLSRFNYQIVHNDSPDERGIDVALLFRNESFTVIESRFITVTRSGEPDWKTRDIVYVRGIASGIDTIHLFVNHWPSRYGGELETEDYRLVAATALRKEIDRVFTADPEASIIIMGDFNDNPEDLSIRTRLKVENEIDTTDIDDKILYNLSKRGENTMVPGTHKYQMNWALLDQIIVSGRLLISSNQLTVRPDGFTVFSSEFLLVPDEVNMGVKPFRTYDGFRYQNGFSDHLPIYVDLWKNVSGD